MKYLVGVITEGEDRKVRLEALSKAGIPTGKYKDYEEYEAADCYLHADEKGQLVLETPEPSKKKDDDADEENK